MSRVTALLGGKRNKGDSASKSREENGSSSVSSTPERDRGLVSVTRRDRKPSFAESATSNADRTGVIKRQASSSSMTLQSTTPDGTPIVYGSTTEENASRSGRLAAEDGSANGKIRRGTFSRGGPALDLPRVAIPEVDAGSTAAGESSQFPTRAMPSFQPVGEGSLSLDTLLGPSQHDAVTPKAGHLQFRDQGPVPLQQPTLFVTGASPLPSPVPGSEDSRYRRPTPAESDRQQYPPVFEHSDLGSSSSSSTASRSEGQAEHSGEATGPHPPLQAQSTEDHRGRAMSMLSPADSLVPPLYNDSHSGTRGRASTSASSLASGRSSISPSPSRSATAPVRANKNSKKSSNGIAGALALSGVAFASPAPGVAHPFQMAGQVATPLTISRPSSTQKRGSSGMISRSANDGTFDNDGHYNYNDRQLPERRSTEECEGFESPTPLSNYTPNDSPRYEDDPAFHAMVSMDALGDFDDVVTQIGTGYALASSKRNAEFHALFKNVPEDDYLIEDYGCALQREILMQGRLYISEHRLCFNANIFGWVTTLTLDFHEIIAIEKRNTALVIPNAILIATMHNRNTFASFISRDMTYDLIVSLWRNSHPVVPTSAALPDSAGIIEDDDEDFAQSHNEEHTGNEADMRRKKRRMRKGRFRKTKGSGSKQESLAVEGGHGNEEGGELETAPSSKGRPSLGRAPLVRSPTAIQHPPTTCNCTTGGTGHFANVVMDATFPGSPEKLYNLMFTSGFMKDFLTKDMKLTDLQIGDWAPEKNGSHLLSRTYSYIKAINAPVGPKSTKCILTDENLHVDFDDFVVNLTTTKTPEVPSGGSFSVKTKTCFTWARNNTTRVLVTTVVEWTGRSFIKSIVDRSSLDGQKTLYVALDSSIRKYISAHKSEFYASGEEDDQAEQVQSGADSLHSRNPSSATAGGEGESSSRTMSSKPKEPLSFIADTVPYSKPFCDFANTLWDTIPDILGQMSPSTLICSFIIFALLLSNVFTLSSLRKSSSRYTPQRRPLPGNLDGGRNAFMHDDSDEQEVVAAAVRGALHEYFQHANAHARPPHNKKDPASILPREIHDSEEAREIWSMIESLEKRVEALKGSLQDLN